MALATTKRYMQYNSRILKALKEMEKCRIFIKSKQISSYATHHPERISKALFYLDEAKIILWNSNTAFFGGEIKITVK
jgi:NADH/NAD ratio-sensing transcriptional regulator Rex